MAEEAKTTEMAAATETAVSEFRPIESQEAFDAAIKDRIERAQNKIRKEYEGFADYKAKAETYDSKVAELTESLKQRDASIEDLSSKVAKYETDSVKTRIANEFKLDTDLIEFLSGDEKAMRKQAEKLANKSRIPYPKAQAERPVNGENADLLRMSRELRK